MGRYACLHESNFGIMRGHNNICIRKKPLLLVSCIAFTIMMSLSDLLAHSHNDQNLLNEKAMFEKTQNSGKLTSFSSSNEISRSEMNPFRTYEFNPIKTRSNENRKTPIKNPDQQLFRREYPNKRSKSESVYCQGHFSYNNEFVLLQNVILDPSKKRSHAVGGEDILSVIGNSEGDEDVKVKYGFFDIPCKQIPPMRFPLDSHFANWMTGFSFRDRNKTDGIANVYPFTVLVRRVNYANLYWTLIELYNTYRIIRLLNYDPKATVVILMDAHPAGKLDSLWNILFGAVYRIGQIKEKTLHTKLAWVSPDGPMSREIQTVPFVQEFKTALYRGVMNSPSVHQNCTKSDIQNVTLILRRNYVAHPRNPSGKIKRKLRNEQELIEYLSKNIPNAHINPIQMDMLRIEEQIKIIYETNVLVGVHGAGLGHTLLLRSGSTVVELFPSSYEYSPNVHFQQFAYWADVIYNDWYSTAKPEYDNEWINVDPAEVTKIIQSAVDRSCQS